MKLTISQIVFASCLMGKWWLLILLRISREDLVLATISLLRLNTIKIAAMSKSKKFLSKQGLTFKMDLI